MDLRLLGGVGGVRGQPVEKMALIHCVAGVLVGG